MLSIYNITDKPALTLSVTLGTMLVVCLTLLSVSMAVAVTESKAKARIRAELETVMRDQSLQTSHINTDENIAYGMQNRRCHKITISKSLHIIDYSSVCL